MLDSNSFKMLWPLVLIEIYYNFLFRFFKSIKVLKSKKLFTTSKSHSTAHHLVKLAPASSQRVKRTSKEKKLSFISKCFFTSPHFEQESMLLTLRLFVFTTVFVIFSSERRQRMEKLKKTNKKTLCKPSKSWNFKRQKRKFREKEKKSFNIKFPCHS